MRKKTINIYEYTTVGKNPGPGTYKSVHNLATNGNYFVSKYKNACCRIIAPGASRRFKGKVRGHGNPGPGTYSKKPMELGDKGNYFISKLKNSGAGFFSKQKRKLGGSSTCTPGPGSYIMPSDFGVY